MGNYINQLGILLLSLFYFFLYINQSFCFFFKFTVILANTRPTECDCLGAEEVRNAYYEGM